MASRKVLSILMSLTASLVLAACGPAPAPTETGAITVFAASSLTDAFTEIAEAFESAHPGVEVTLNFGASSQLATQINEGAPADVFASASGNTFKTVTEAGHAADPAVFATNRLTIIAPSDNPARIASLKDLANPGVKLVLAVRGVPVRDYAEQIFTKAGESSDFGADFPTKALANLVSEEDNVRLVVTKVALGEADAGICYITDVTTDQASNIHQIAIPDNLNVIASYPIGTVKESTQAGLAQAFVDFVLSSEGQSILARWGFGPKE